jgi:hypothetical protein
MAMKAMVVPLMCSVVLAACQPVGSSACPAVTAPRGVIFKLPSGGHFDVPVAVRACVEQDCLAHDLTSPRISTPWIVAGQVEAAGGRPVSVRLSIWDLSNGKVRFDASTRVTFRAIASIPCDADVGGYQASVVATTAGTLVPD